MAEVNDYRITKLRSYMFDILNTLTKTNNYQIGADFLGDIGDFSLDKMPTESTVEIWILGPAIKKDVYSLRSRKTYSQDTINNLKSIGFFEELESIIETNNEKGILPDIENIESIECLNCGTLNNVNGTEATFDMQIQITYRI
ncbi:MAG TPA: hypothetical protein HA355_05245 [Methanosphaera sp.]|nr:hypothetical protein [Methanosphaera sp.]